MVTLAGSSASGNDLTANPGAFGIATLATTAHKSGAGATSYGASVSGAYAGVSNTAFDGSNFSLNGQSVLASSGYTGGAAAQDATSAYAKAAAINPSDIDGITASAQTQLSFGTTGGTNGSTDFLAMWSQGAGATPGKIDYSLTINGVQVITYNETFGTSGNIPTSIGATTIGLSMNDAVSAINAAQGSTGVSAALDADGNLQLAAADGRNIRIQESLLADVQNVHPESAIVRSAFSQLVQTGWEASMTQDHTYRGQLTLSSKGNVAMSGTASAAGFTGSETLAGSNLASANVLDVDQANATIQVVDEALTTVFNIQSRFGAIQNRLDSVVSSLGITTESLSAARSRIQDADFAQETAELTRAQILQQAGTAMLAQANSLPQSVLNLLRQ
jgi:flagellin